MRKTSTGTFGIILTLLILGLSVSADPIFTGDVPADFTARDVVIIPDRADVGTLPGIFELSGWDMADVYFDYDHATDVLYVGVDCFGICGDADGDGDPGGTSVLLGSAGGEDFRFWRKCNGQQHFELITNATNGRMARILPEMIINHSWNSLIRTIRDKNRAVYRGRQVQHLVDHYKILEKASLLRF